MSVFIPPFDIERCREKFPILSQQVHKSHLIYFDNAATTHKPLAVIERLVQFYTQDNANIHRGVHALSTRATKAIEETRKAVQQFIHASSSDEIIFTSGTTESLNLVASSYGHLGLNQGDEVLISDLEHHSNILPWKRICQEKKACLKVLPIHPDGTLDLSKLDVLLTKRTKIVALNYISNTLGVVSPIQHLIERAHACGAIVVVDGAQAVAHFPIDVMALDCDFFAFSAHKMYGPTGLGVLYGKKKWLQEMVPYQTGGGMVRQFVDDQPIYEELPYKFEAGTPPLAAIVAFLESIRFILSMDSPSMVAYERELYHYAWDHMRAIDQVQLFGGVDVVDQIGSIAFNISGLHHLDVGLLLDAQGIAVRTGHCCTRPLMDKLGVDGVVRLSLAIYNTKKEVDYFLQVLEGIIHQGPF